MNERPVARPISRPRLVLAFVIAGLADALSIVLVLATPVQWVVDLATAVSLFLVLGRNWILLPGLVMEAIPGLYVFPFWVLVVVAIAAGRAIRPKPDVRGPSS